MQIRRGVDQCDRQQTDDKLRYGEISRFNIFTLRALRS